MARDKWKSEKLGYLDRRFGAGQDTRWWKNGFWMPGYMSACILEDYVWCPRPMACIPSSFENRVMLVVLF